MNRLLCSGNRPGSGADGCHARGRPQSLSAGTHRPNYEGPQGGQAFRADRTGHLAGDGKVNQNVHCLSVAPKEFACLVQIDLNNNTLIALVGTGSDRTLL